MRGPKNAEVRQEGQVERRVRMLAIQILGAPIEALR